MDTKTNLTPELKEIYDRVMGKNQKENETAPTINETEPSQNQDLQETPQNNQNNTIVGEAPTSATVEATGSQPMTTEQTPQEEQQTAIPQISQNQEVQSQESLNQPEAVQNIKPEDQNELVNPQPTIEPAQNPEPQNNATEAVQNENNNPTHSSQEPFVQQNIQQIQNPVAQEQNILSSQINNVGEPQQNSSKTIIVIMISAIFIIMWVVLWAFIFGFIKF